MKARLLSGLLNNPGYIIHDNGKCVCVGSSMCNDLISVDKQTLEIKYALDTFHEGRKSIRDEILRQIWDRLHELVENGGIQDIINGKDEIENPLPVFIADDGMIRESVTDKYGWPNTTADGELMYDNVCFPARKQAVKRGIEDMKAAGDIHLRTIRELSQRLSDCIARYQKDIRSLERLEYELKTLQEANHEQEGAKEEI
ncbi:MAG: hypothetical protein LBK61_01425 [Spirochaetaceae bacterium]|jgi:hypothetical protein|nr:hypothetical protein [Spirochaetaceae bacterium]